MMQSTSSRLLLLLVLLLLVSGCVTTSNECGNEDRDWSDLQFPKSRYCSVPENVPFGGIYEAANKAVCKVHDNNSGIHAEISQREADKRFLCDYIKRSDLPWGVRHVTGYLSYFTLRITDSGIEGAEGTESIETAEDSSENSSLTPSAAIDEYSQDNSRSANQITTDLGKTLLDSNDQPVTHSQGEE